MKSLYRNSYAGELKLAFSACNIGETLGILDKVQRIRRLNEESYMLTRAKFLAETTKLTRLEAHLLV